MIFHGPSQGLVAGIRFFRGHAHHVTLERVCILVGSWMLDSKRAPFRGLVFPSLRL